MNTLTDTPIKSLRQILELAEGLVRKYGPYRVALAAADDVSCIGGLELGRKMGLIKPILVGHRRRVDKVFKKLDISQDGWDIYADKVSKSATQNCAEGILKGDAEILMRGRLMARDFIKALLDPKLKLKTCFQNLDYP